MTLEKVLEDCKKIAFLKKRATKREVNSETVKENYEFLKSIGCSDERILHAAFTLYLDSRKIKQNYQKLITLGLSQKKIVSQLQLLGRKHKGIERNYRLLSEIGLASGKIDTHAYLLGMNPDTLEKNYVGLKNIGLTQKRIATAAQLLGRSSDTLKRNYQHHVGLLREKYTDRNSGRDILTTKATILGVSPATLEANIQWFADKDISHKRGLLLTVKPQTRRKKLAWMLREVFDYRQVSTEDRSTTIDQMYDFVRDSPDLLFNSINKLQKRKNELRNKVEMKYGGKND
jgi:hypothetical protein